MCFGIQAQCCQVMVCLVENLTLRVWFLSILPWLLRKRRNHTGPIRHCYVIDGSTLALKVAQKTARLAYCSVERFAFRLVEVRDDNGLLIRLRIPYRDLAKVQAMAMAEPDFRDVTDGDYEKDKLRTYLSKSIATNSLSDRGTLWRALLLVQICVWKARKEGLRESRQVVFLESRPWLGAVARYAKAFGVHIVQVEPALSMGRLVRRLLTPRGVAVARALRDRLWHSWLLLRGGGKAVLERDGSDSQTLATPMKTSKDSRTNDGPKIAVEYCGQFNLGLPERYCDLFFWQQSSLSGGDILLTFGFPQDPLDEEKWSQLKAHGISAIALHPGATVLQEVPMLTRSIWAGKTGGKEKRLPALRGSREAKWLKQQVAAYYSLREYWRKLFEARKVKIYITWNRYDDGHCPIADALQELGGVTAIYQRALQVDPSPGITINADIMFGYSPLDALVEKKSNSVISYHVAVGYLGDHRFPLLREAAQLVRSDLKKNGAEYILAFFDENSADDSRWHTGHEFQRENYAFLLEKMLAEPWLGLVFKPKYPPTLRKRLGPVAELLKRAEATGRCYIYEEGPLHGSYPPAVAALAADLAIHGHLCAATAGLEAALAGVPTLLLDREGWHVSLLYRLGVGRVVFKKWEELWDALMEHRKAPSGIEGFGDWSPMLNDIDPFRDGRAAERMGTYLKWLIDGFKAGLGRETVLADAAERYCRLWGQDKITAVNPQSCVVHCTVSEKAENGAAQVKSRNVVEEPQGSAGSQTNGRW